MKFYSEVRSLDSNISDDRLEEVSIEVSDKLKEVLADYESDPDELGVALYAMATFAVFLMGRQFGAQAVRDAMATWNNNLAHGEGLAN